MKAIYLKLDKNNQYKHFFVPNRETRDQTQSIMPGTVLLYNNKTKIELGEIQESLLTPDIFLAVCV